MPFPEPCSSCRGKSAKVTRDHAAEPWCSAWRCVQARFVLGGPPAFLGEFPEFPKLLDGDQELLELYPVDAEQTAGFGVDQVERPGIRAGSAGPLRGAQ